MEKRALVIVNPSSGKEKAEEYANHIVEILKDRYKTITVKKTEGAGDAKRFASDATVEGYDLVIAMGGDGTVNEAVNGIAPHDRRPIFGIIPLGTVNDLGRALDIPLEPEDAVKVFGEEHLQTIDIAKIGDRYFASGMAIGKIPESIHEVSAEEKSKLGPVAYVIAGAKKLFEQEKISLKVSFDETEWSGELTALVISLTGSIGGMQDILPNAEFEDGKLHVLLIHDINLGEAAKLIPKLMSGKIAESENISYIATEKITIVPVGHENYISDIDGEEGPRVPFTVESLRSHIKVLVPSKEELNK